VERKNYCIERYIKQDALEFREANVRGMYSRQGPVYKSKGEERIADYLVERNIAFQYEYPLAIMDRGLVRIWYPDFRLPEYNMIIEYFGMNANTSYNEQIAHKIRTYQEAGIDGIYLLESSFSGGWKEGITARIEQSLEGKLRKIRSIYQQNDAVPARR